MKAGSFRDRVLRAAARIPAGRVTTYAALAAAVGSPHAVRAVGGALKSNDQAPRIPCHRVISSDGRLGGYAFGQAKKHARLVAEGVMVVRGRVDLDRFGIQAAFLQKSKN